jgi:Rieske Fe-S protein
MNRDISEATNEMVSDERNVRAAIAQYQAEFPYERDDEAQVTRREFCNFLFLTSGALFAGSAAFAGKSLYDSRNTRQFAAAKIDGAESLKPGTALNFFYPNENDTAILIRTNDGQYHAYEQKCTHLTCPVYFAKDRNRLECPCHEGGFDVKTGNVLYGPPPRPLDRIDLEVRGAEVWAVGVTKGENNEPI